MHISVDNTKNTAVISVGQKAVEPRVEVPATRGYTDSAALFTYRLVVKLLEHLIHYYFDRYTIKYSVSYGN